MLLIVTAQAQLTAEILRPESDRKEGGQVQIKCTATNFNFQNYILEWQKDGITLKSNEETVTSDPKLIFSTVHEMNKITNELLGIGITLVCIGAIPSTMRLEALLLQCR